MDYQLRDLLVSADDHMVAGRAIDGDVDAFAVLIERYSPMMRACVHRMLNSNRDVDDIVQESFLVAWQQLDSLQDPGKVKSWLMRIASRRTIDRMRKTDREQAGLQGIEIEVPAHEAPEHVVESAAKLEALGEILRDLPENQRCCWVLREIGGCSYQEIAEELEAPVSTVRGLLARARQHIIARMEVWR